MSPGGRHRLQQYCRASAACFRADQFGVRQVELYHNAEDAVDGAGLDQIRRGQPHLLAPSPLRSRQPPAIGIPHDPGRTQVRLLYQRV